MKKQFKGKYFISPVGYTKAMDLVVSNHYLHRKCPCSFAFGLFEKNGDMSGLFPMDKMKGVIVYGTPSSSTLRRGICGVEEKDNVIELVRLWICDSMPKNSESFLIGNTLKKVDKEIIVSFAEIQAGHVGTVYQATNWIYTGLSAKRTDWKIRGCDKHSQTLADRMTKKEMIEKFGDDFYISQRPRKHRYIYLNCSKTRKKQLLSKLNYKIKKYPKYEKTTTIQHPKNQAQRNKRFTGMVRDQLG